MLMPQRNYTNSEYRYGFNGKETDDEVSGKGNSYDYGFRIYNPRLGKFLSVDPLSFEFPWYSPYHFAGNKPIWALDIDGLEDVIYTYEREQRETKAKLVKTEHFDIPGPLGPGVLNITFVNSGILDPGVDKVSRQFLPSSENRTTNEFFEVEDESDFTAWLKKYDFYESNAPFETAGLGLDVTSTEGPLGIRGRGTLQLISGSENGLVVKAQAKAFNDLDLLKLKDPSLVADDKVETFGYFFVDFDTDENIEGVPNEFNFSYGVSSVTTFRLLNLKASYNAKSNSLKIGVSNKVGLEWKTAVRGEVGVEFKTENLNDGQ